MKMILIRFIPRIYGTQPETPQHTKLVNTLFTLIIGGSIKYKT
ncbi:hypothetical protein R11007_00507 [Ralstonia holmesii]|nr:hypothetical protein R11007_00507 [Ralstonia sp. LMG 32967]